MSNPELEERTETKSKISCTAFQLFCQRGIKSVSMDDIAQFLSMSKKTIYKWFENKNEIVVASTGAYLQDMQDRCEVHFQSAGNAIEELFNMMAMTRELFNQFHPSIFHDLQKYHPEAFKLWMQDFLPQLKKPEFTMEVAEVSDRSDGKLVHLDGLNFSRAWVLHGLANQYPKDYGHLRALAEEHIAYSFPNLVGDTYEGGHWLGTFALYALQEKNPDK